MDLIADLLDGSRLALSRLLTQVENDTLSGRQALSQLFPYTGRAHLIGVTGAPGTGKSSLVNQLARVYRVGEGFDNPGSGVPRRVAIVAVDPTSPFTGGAILGDRVRMRDLAGDPGVFIRSMATRGSLGGLARTTAGMVQVFDAAGFEVILIETVGAGQSEVDIARLAHTTLVVEAPGLGDDIQAIKAGILEVADILVINKADRPGAELTERALRSMLQLAHPVPHVFQHHGHSELVSGQPLQDSTRPVWITPIQRTVATDGAGICDLADEIQRHNQYLHETGEWAQRDQARLRAELDMLLQEMLVTRWQENLPADLYLNAVNQVAQRKVSPWMAAEELIAGS